MLGTQRRERIGGNYFSRNSNFKPDVSIPVLKMNQVYNKFTVKTLVDNVLDAPSFRSM